MIALLSVDGTVFVAEIGQIIMWEQFVGDLYLLQTEHVWRRFLGQLHDTVKAQAYGIDVPTHDPHVNAPGTRHQRP